MASELGVATGASRALRQLDPGRDAADGFVARVVVLRRQLSDGAVAGTVIGVIVGVGLLVFCLYPVVVYYFKRRRRAKRSLLDPEAARPGSPRCAELAAHRRLSSSDSFKLDGDVSRGVKAPPSKEHDGDGGTRGTGFAGDGPRPSMGPDATPLGGPRDAAQPPAGDAGPQSAPSPLPFYYGEYMPESEVMRDDNPGVLKGTSADYYSPSIPSSAFGMMTTPPDVNADAPRAGSRTSSLRYNFKHMFRRRSGRDAAGALGFYGATALRQVAGTEGPTESPTELSPTTAAPGPVPYAASSTKPQSTSPPPSAKPPPQPQYLERSFKASPSPPSFPAPGTVNPMDIMPASTESEVWHRTEHRLLASTHGWPQVASPVPEQHYQSMGYAPVASSPLPPAAAQPQTTQIAQSLTPTEARGHVKEEQSQVHDIHDIAMADAHPNDLSPSSMAEASRHPSFPSDQSTSFRGPGSTTDPSSHNTPSSQMDSPTPESMNSSDFRHSVSPQPGVPSLKPGQFTCDKPGCHQTFDQPHKLKHHQRYHSKDHKCPYANCGKGFGTKTHLQRHINDRHEKKKFHCSVPGCDYSRAGGKAFPRKDNWKRHMTKIHNMDQTQLPEPVEVDHDMGEV